jgi:hypothetical protein
VCVCVCVCGGSVTGAGRGRRKEDSLSLPSQQSGGLSSHSMLISARIFPDRIGEPEKVPNTRIPKRISKGTLGSRTLERAGR